MSVQTVHSTSVPASSKPQRKAWESPRVVFEQVLEASAQGGPPGGSQPGFLGPLGTSGGSGTCL